MIITVKGRAVDYTKDGVRILAVEGFHIIKTSEKLDCKTFFYRSDSPDYNTVMMMKHPTLCHADQEERRGRDGSRIVYFNLQAVEEIDLNQYFTRKK